METRTETIHPLAAYRRRKGLSQDDLARKIRQASSGRVKCKKGTVSRWETGAREVDADKMLRIVSEVTGISPRVLRPDLAELFFPAKKNTRQRASAAA